MQWDFQPYFNPYWNELNYFLWKMSCITRDFHDNRDSKCLNQRWKNQKNVHIQLFYWQTFDNFDFLKMNPLNSIEKSFNLQGWDVHSTEKFHFSVPEFYVMIPSIIIVFFSVPDFQDENFCNFYPTKRLSLCL